MSVELRRSVSGQPPLVVQVWGAGALFTRPEFRVERLTYPVMTPTAAIGILESIFWKPDTSPSTKRQTRSRRLSATSSNV